MGRWFWAMLQGLTVSDGMGLGICLGMMVCNGADCLWGSMAVVFGLGIMVLTVVWWNVILDHGRLGN